MVKLICQNDLPTVPSACFAGGIESYNLDQILEVGLSVNDWLFIFMVSFLFFQIFYLYDITNPESKAKRKKWLKFTSFGIFENFANNTGDVELTGKINIVKEHKSSKVIFVWKINLKYRYICLFFRYSKHHLQN